MCIFTRSLLEYRYFDNNIQKSHSYNLSTGKGNFNGSESDDFLIAFKPIFNAILNDVAKKKAFFLYEKKNGVI